MPQNGSGISPAIYGWVRDARGNYAAALLTTAAYVPQLVRVIRLRSARDISLPTFLMFALGVFFWLLYGLCTGSRPIIACNAANLFLSMSIVLLKLQFDRHPTEELHS